MEILGIRRSSPIKPEGSLQKSYDLDRDLSIERCLEEDEEAKKQQIDIDKDAGSKNVLIMGENVTKTLNKLKDLYTASWDEIQSYLKSIPNPSLENVSGIQASTIADLNDIHDFENVSNKKWVIYDMVKLGFEEKQIKEAVDFVETFPEDLPKEDMLRKTVEHFIEPHKTIDQVIIEMNEEKVESHKSVDSVVIQVKQEQIVPRIDNFIEREKQSSPIKLHSLFKVLAPPIEETKETEMALVTETDPKKEEKEDNHISEKVDEKNKKPVKKMIAVCHICYNSYSIEELKPLLKCSHAFCRDCYASYVEAHIRSNKILNIACPKSGCDQVFEHEDIVKLIDKDEAERYIRLHRNALLNQNPDLRWCIRPGCDKYVIATKKNANKLVCECGTKICFKCGNKYHFGRSCGSAVDKVYKKYSNKHKVKNCPQCKSRTEKNGGCNHITCVRCTYEWCWLCDGKYNRNHYEPSNPDHCPKLEKLKSNEHNRERPVPKRETYLSSIFQEPLRILALPLFILFSSIFFPHWVVTQYRKRNKNSRITFEDEVNSVCLFALIGVIMLPVSAVIFFVLMLCDGLIDLYIWINKKVKGKDYVPIRIPVLQPQLL